jgi:hypothetical protein
MVEGTRVGARICTEELTAVGMLDWVSSAPTTLPPGGGIEAQASEEVGEGEVSVGAESRASRVAWRRATSFSKLGIRATSFSRLATRASSAAEEGEGDGREAGGADEGENEGVVATFAQVP